MVRYPMVVRCKFPMEVQMVGQKFQTMKDCPAGILRGTEPGDLMDVCVKCLRVLEPKEEKE